MSLYSLLTVAGTASLAFGGNAKDRLSYSENKHDYPSPSRDEWPSKKWASHKYDKSSGHAYGNKGPRGHDSEWYSMRGDYRSSSYSASDSKWSKSSSDSASSDDYKPSGHAYVQRSIPKQTYGNAFSMHKDEEPKANWKKPSRDWKKNDGKYKPKGRKGYAPKYEPKKPQWAKDYPSKHHTMKPTQEPYKKTDYPTYSTTASSHVYPSMKPVYEPKYDEPADYEPKDDGYDPKQDYEEPMEDIDDDIYGTAYSMMGIQSLDEALAWLRQHFGMGLI